MSEPRDETDEPADGIDGAAPLDFDPYRFGAPEHPVPPEYAPPGYVPPTPPPPPSSGPYGQPPTPPSGPYGAPPAGAPYGPPSGSPYGQPYGQYGQYGQQPGYGPPPGTPYPPVPPQFQPGYPARPAGHGQAVASLVLGIVSIALCWTTIVDVVPVALAVVFGIIARRRATVDPRVGGKGMATAGIVCGIVGAVLAIALTVVVSRAISHCNQYNSGSTEFNNCIEHYVHLK